MDYRLLPLRIIECVTDDEVITVLDENLLRCDTDTGEELILELRDEYADELSVLTLQGGCSVTLYVIQFRCGLKHTLSHGITDVAAFAVIEHIAYGTDCSAGLLRNVLQCYIP